MKPLTRSQRILESFYFVYGIVMLILGAAFHEWTMAAIMAIGIVASGLIQQWRKQPSTVLPEQAEKLSRQQQLKLNGGSHTSAEWRMLCRLYNWRCAACLKLRPLTKDHIIPVIQGGRDDISNIQPLCRECNNRKHGRAMEY